MTQAFQNKSCAGITHLEHEAEVGGGFELAPEVFAVVDVDVVKLDEADEVTGRLTRREGGKKETSDITLSARDGHTGVGGVVPGPQTDDDTRPAAQGGAHTPEPCVPSDLSFH